MVRHQRGSLRRETRKKGDVWVLRFYKTRPEDGRRVEDSLVVGPLSEFKSESAAWAEVERQQLMLPVNNPLTHMRCAVPPSSGIAITAGKSFSGVLGTGRLNQRRAG